MKFLLLISFFITSATANSTKIDATNKVKVAIIDTGIDLNETKYQPFVSPLSKNFDPKYSGAKSSELSIRILDQHGHGTHIAGLILGSNPFKSEPINNEMQLVENKNVSILALKYYNAISSGMENLSNSEAALKYAIQQNVDIINYSGGGPEAAPGELKLLKEAQKKGILVIVAAGNESSNIDISKFAYFPANYNLPNIITVGNYESSSQAITIASSSNYGKKTVNVFAPGYRIKSNLQNGRMGYLTGTSQATAIVTNLAVALKTKYPNLTAYEIKKKIESSVIKFPGFEKYCSSGGVISFTKALADEKNDRSHASVKQNRK